MVPLNGSFLRKYRYVGVPNVRGSKEEPSGRFGQHKEVLGLGSSVAS